MFKDRLRATRIARGHTLQKTADALGIALRSYQKYESGDSEPSFNYLVALADFLDVPTDFLLERDAYLQSLLHRLPSIRSTSRNSPLVSVQMPISTSPQIIMGGSPPPR